MEAAQERIIFGSERLHKLISDDEITPFHPVVEFKSTASGAVGTDLELGAETKSNIVRARNLHFTLCRFRHLHHLSLHFRNQMVSEGDDGGVGHCSLLGLPLA